MFAQGHCYPKKELHLRKCNMYFETFLPAAQRHGHKEGGIGDLGTFRSCSLFTSYLQHGLLEGGIGKLLGQLGPVPFFLHGKPQNLKDI